MRTSDFDYQLASELIAQTPAEPRDHSRLMVIHRDDGSIEHRQFFEITEFLRTGDVMVLNDSRVIPARLMGRRQSGGKTEVLLLRRLEAGLWEALVRPSKRIKAGERIELFGMRQKPEAIPATIEVLERSEQGLRTVRLDNEAILEELGEIPLPPYIHDYSGDPERYQTVYARENGSVAAPTAGLHFTPQLLQQVKEKGIEIAFVTLHVGLDSFRPVSEEDPQQHLIHKEYGELSEETAAKLNSARANGNRIVSAGTTTVRLLEQAAQANRKPEPLESFRGWATLFILPGHQFKMVDVLITNFHLPRSTLLMLVSAFAGKELIDRAYQEAMRLSYRFYSFGDAMLII
ncbi:MAG: tRNA preQ1(34) S-adenosylmethionine ribosyltransferase-isomerase QueA [Chloroflexi bacterium RBG_13_53_26]|jgi:S-adenosylmethionine:tRNA ribosyltransferase-isomerase|nr:MAG: tRNA preQ1(34) S-adenosylmethionine ribosyltransferase-isomerase QueA [Chloroflexi bacterium RBG_13_53_26]